MLTAKVKRSFKSTLKNILKSSLSTKEHQHMPTPNRPLWHKDHFELKKSNNRKNSLLSPFCLKGHKFPSVKVLPRPTHSLTGRRRTSFITVEGQSALRLVCKTNLTKITLSLVSSRYLLFLKSPKPFSFVLSFLHNLSHFVKIVKGSQAEHSLGFYFFVKPFC